MAVMLLFVVFELVGMITVQKLFYFILIYFLNMAKIFVTRAIPNIGIEKLKSAGHEVVVSTKDGVLTRTELLETVSAQPYEAIVSLLSDTIDAEVLAHAPKVKIVANYAVGYNNINVADATQAGVVVTNTPDVLTDSVAEFTVALLLAVAKRIPEAERFTRAGTYEGWAPQLLLGSDLKGKTLGIVGAGRIGCRVAEIMSRGFGMKIAYCDMRRNEYLDALEDVTYYEQVNDLLPNVDVVSIHVPLLPSTHHLIGTEQFALMKRTAYLINTARGPIVDETALVSALSEGLIAGAGLDVFEAEPKVTEALLTMENVVLTPHIASATQETRDKMSVMVANNVLAVLSGKHPPNQVVNS